MGEKRGKHTLPTTRLTSRPSSPTAPSGLHSLHRTIIGQKDYDASISNTIAAREEGKEAYVSTSGELQSVERRRTESDARHTKCVLVKTAPRGGATHLVAEYLWLPEFGTQQAYHRIPIAT